MKIVRLILLILHVGIFLLLSGMLMNAYIPPKIFPWLNLLSLGFPFLITGYLLLTIFWIISWKKRAFVFLFAGLLFFNATVRWVNFSSEKKEAADLKIVTFNTKGGILEGREKIQQYLKSQNADIIFLQEDRGSGFEFNKYNKSNAKAILTIFTKHKISGDKLIDSQYVDVNAYGTQTDLEIKGKLYRLINVYLHPFKFDKNMVKLDGSKEEKEQKLKNIIKRLIPTFKEHQEQINVLRKAIENSPYPVILAGDFNSVPNSYEYYHLGEGLQDAFIKVGNGSATSFHDYKFPIRIDYIFTSKSIQPITYKVDRSVKISDHYPVVATFKLR
ncbi:endonuclease/exonuclease/phosphatase family protein [Chryseobacterium sp. MMS23-Vi53]|uniref:endonuclease/exonuclease/phosphatase family protein n=1 Tax=Chryseobacterium sp. MMS23-Vi53 TaxID=3386644 RepID=UPI0039E85121